MPTDSGWKSLRVIYLDLRRVLRRKYCSRLHDDNETLRDTIRLKIVVTSRTNKKLHEKVQTEENK